MSSSYFSTDFSAISPIQNFGSQSHHIRIIVGSDHMHVGFTSPHPTTIILDTMRPSTASSNLSLMPEQIQCRINDYDSQIRQGLEDGTIRNVVKRLRQVLVSTIIFSPASQLTESSFSTDRFVCLSKRHPGTTSCMETQLVYLSVHSCMEHDRNSAGPRFC